MLLPPSNKIKIKMEGKNNLEFFRIAYKNSMSSYRQALKVARLNVSINNQTIPGFYYYSGKTFSKQSISSQFSSNDLMNFFTKKTESIRKTIEGVQLLAVSYYSVSYSSPQKLIQCFITIGQKELNK